MADAESFKCTDREGHAYYGDEPPADCKDQVVHGLRNDGAFKRDIAAPESEMEKATRQEKQKQQLAAEEAEQTQYQQDLALHLRFKTVDDLEARRNAELDSQQRKIEAMEKVIAQCDKERERLNVESEFYVGRPKPEKLKREIEANEDIRYINVIAESAALKQMTAINDDFDEKLKRYLAFSDRLAKLAESRSHHKQDEAAK